MSQLSILIIALGFLASSCNNARPNAKPAMKNDAEQQTYPMQLSEAAWKEKLTPAQYNILRQKGTEPAGTGKYDKFYKKGVYYSAASLQPVFSSDTKFDSGTGWPSFYAPVSPDAIRVVTDNSNGIVRGEVVDSKSGSHLGHLFDDGPEPTGQRYCLNSEALIFVAEGGQPPTNSKDN